MPRTTAMGALGGAALLGAASGLLAGIAVAGIDWAWSLGQLGQFLPDFGAKVRMLCFLGGSYGVAGTLAGGAMGAGFWFFSTTQLGALLTTAREAHGAVRALDPTRALGPLALALSSVVSLSASGWVAFTLAHRGLAERHHVGLVVGVAMAAAVGALVAAMLLAFALARAVEPLLRRAARPAPVARALSSPVALVVGTAALVTSCTAVALWAAWDTLGLLHLRAFWVSLAVMAFGGALTPLVRRLLHRGRALERRSRLVLAMALAVSLALALVVAGASDAVRDAATMYTGLGGPLTRVMHSLTDVDRDGYSAILGGGDCDDWNADVHPGGIEIPDDGIDQNCIGGDATLQRDATDVGMAALPDAVPAGLNVLLVVIDTLRADHVGAYGYRRDTTPALDALAREGSLFEHAWAHAPSTRYSMPAILTGRYPLHVRYDYSIPGWPGLLPAAITLGEIVTPHGYMTGAITNHWYFDPVRRLGQGFRSYNNRNARLHVQDMREGPAKSRGSSSRQQTEAALAFFERHGDAPFFLWVHYYDPHYEYETHPGIDFGPNPMDHYDGEVRFTDDHIGLLLTRLREQGIYDRTAVVVTGDHGEGFGEHGIERHGYHLYAPQTKVPLIVRVPGIAPRSVKTAVGHVDLMPTIANLVGEPANDEMMGRSLLGLMTGEHEDAEDRWVFQQLSYEGNNEMRGAASSRCHVIYNVSPRNSWELYLLGEDPGETQNRIDDPGECEGARDTLATWLDWSDIPPGAGAALLDERPELSHPVDVHFGDMLTLLGTELPAEAVQRGATFDLQWTFEAHRRIEEGWRLFVHIYADTGIGFHADHSPPRPLAWWRAGDIIQYTQTVTVPMHLRPGAYTVRMGLFRGQERYPVQSERVTVDEQRAEVGVLHVR